MKKKSNLYEDLGVPKNAPRESIKKAFREKAKKSHPDACGGDGEKFRALMQAYDILSDDEKRKRYDNGENPDGIGQEQQPISMVFTIFNQVLDSNIDYDHNDLFEAVRQTLQGSQQNLSAQRNMHQANIKKYQTIFKRIKRKDESEPFLRFLDDKIKDCNAAVLKIEKDIKVGEAALELIEDCEYLFEPQRRIVMVNFGSGTGTTARW